MSRVPRVRPWIVSYRVTSPFAVLAVEVAAPTKTLALLNAAPRAQELAPVLAARADSITVRAIRKGRVEG